MPASATANNLHPTRDRLISRATKESLLGQRSHAFWFIGLSGAGKTTLANLLERRLAAAGRHTTLLDADNVRTGLCSGLGFSQEDRTENLRRSAEATRLFLDAGIVAINCFITPLESQRHLIRSILGDDVTFIHAHAAFETCARRDPKGLYARAASGDIPSFSGRDSDFEAPTPAVDLISLDTESSTPAELADLLLPLALEATLLR
jgi:adenylylsulfate kinase